MCKRILTILGQLGVLVSVLAMAGRVHGTEAESLLRGGGFELGMDGKVPGWYRNFSPQREGDIDACLSRSEDWARSGSWSLKIDTSPVVGQETALILSNGVSKRDVTRLRGQKLVLTGWVLVQQGTATRPIQMRLRCYGRDAEGKSVFLRNVFNGKVFGEPGQWVPFRFSGTMPDAELTSVSLLCAIGADTAPTVQFLDDIRLTSFVSPPLEVRLPRSAVWHDETVLPVDVRLNGKNKRATEVAFQLIDGQGRIAARWDRPAKQTIFGLTLPQERLAEGVYRLSAELRDADQHVLATVDHALEIATSPWEDASSKATDPENVSRANKAPTEPEVFRATGTVAPTDAADVVPKQAEPLSADVDLNEQRQRGYAVFSRHWLDAVSRLGRPRPGEFGPVRLFACAGEFESATVSVWAIRSQESVRVNVSDLTGWGGTIPANQIDVRLVRDLPGLPRFLEKRPSVDIPRDQTQTFWLTVRVPPDASPGFYRGRIEVATGDAKSTEVELLLRVLPLKLPPSQKGYGFWWAMDSRWKGYYSKPRGVALEQIRRQFILMRDHGCNMVSLSTLPKMTRTENGDVQFDFSGRQWWMNLFSLEDIFRIGRETKFFSPHVPIQYMGAEGLHSKVLAKSLKIDRESREFDTFYRDACRRIADWAGKQGLTLAFACTDEIGNDAERRQATQRKSFRRPPLADRSTGHARKRITTRHERTESNDVWPSTRRNDRDHQHAHTLQSSTGTNR